MHYRDVVKRDIDADRRLVARAKKDPEAFGLIFDTYFDELFGFALRRVGRAEIAEDIIAEVFTKALQKLWQFQFRGIPLSAWLYRITINEINMHYRQGRRASLSLERLIEAGFDPKDPDIISERDAIDVQLTEEFGDRAREVLEFLPTKYRTVISLRYYSNMKTKEIARMLGRREGTIRSLLSRGLVKLRQMLERPDQVQQNTNLSIEEDEGRIPLPAPVRTEL